MVESALSSSRQGKCVSNLHQIGVACLAFAMDNDGGLPPETTIKNNEPALAYIWTQSIEPYIPLPPKNPNGSGSKAKSLSDSVYFCPEANPEREWAGTCPDYGCAARLNNLPGISTGVFSRQAWGSNLPLVKLSAIKTPSKVLMVADCYTTDPSNPKSLENGTWELAISKLTTTTITADPPSSLLAPRHGYNGQDARTGRFNAVFCDGHVESISYGDPKLKSADYCKQLTIPY